MREPDSIHDPLQTKLYNASVPPPEQVWTNIEATLRKRRRRIFLWWFLAGAGLCGLIAGYLFLRPGAPPKQPARDMPVARTEQSAGRPLTPSGASSPEKTGITTPLTAAEPSTTARPAVAARSSAQTAPLSTLSTAAPQPLPAGRTIRPAFLLHTNAPERLAVPERDNTPPTVRIAPFKKKKETKDCYDFVEHPNAWLVDVYGGPVLPGSERSTSDSEFTHYVQQLNATETPGFAFQAGLRTSLLLRRHWLLRTGLDYEQRNTTFEYADPNYIEYTVKVRTELINGVWQTVTDTIGVDYGEHYQKVYNRFGALDIPLMVGYEWRHGRTGVNIQAGASLNVLFWKRGSILSPQGSPAVFTPSASEIDVYRTRIGASLSGSIQWFWHLQPRLRVFAEPYYRQVLQPVTLNSFPVEQRYNMLGLRIGLTKILD